MNNFCPMPFINLETRTDASCSVCCQMDRVIHTDGKPVNLVTDVPSTAWRSSDINSIRDQFLENVQPRECYSCWQAESAGVDSKRLRALRDFPDVETRVRSGYTYDKPLSLDLKFGNICNNKCRTCTSFASSQWVPEERDRVEGRDGLWNRMRIQGRWPDRNSAVWQDLTELASDVHVLEFYGGEPLLIAQHKEILHQSVANRQAVNTTLSYNTNGTVFPGDYLELWGEFKRVHLSFSIDAIDLQFNYIRHPADFDQIILNLRRLCELKMNNLLIDICFTVSIFNIMSMRSMVDYFTREFPEIDIHFNHVYTPIQYSCRILPDAVKAAIREYYRGVNHRDIVASVQYMSEGEYDSAAMREFYASVRYSDTYRGESFSGVFPELDLLLRRYDGANYGF